MFNFFKKKETQKNLGTFSAYGMEEVYKYLTEFRIIEKRKELKDRPTLGTSFDDFMDEEHVKSPSGELHFYVWLLWYFSYELDLGLYLFEKSKFFSESDYPKKTSLKVICNEHLKTMDRMAEKYPEERTHYLFGKRPIFWIEYDMLYVELLKNFVFNFNLQKFAKLNITGEFDRKGSKINNSKIEILFRVKRKPKIGYYLTFKSEMLLMDMKFDLIEMKENTFIFNTFFATYQIIVSDKSAHISKVQLFNNEKINLIISTDFISILNNLISNYLKNFEKISKRYTNEIRKTDINFLFYIALQIKEIDPDLILQIEEKLKDYNELWGDIQKYHQGAIAGFDLKIKN
jgi:hypothetical protein